MSVRNVVIVQEILLGRDKIFVVYFRFRLILLVEKA